MNDVIDLVRKVEVVGIACKRFDQIQKRMDGICRAAVQLIAGNGACGSPHRTTVGTRITAHHIRSARADAAGWLVDDALERAVVVAVRYQSQVRQRVLDFSALKEAQSAVDAIWNIGVNESFFKRTRLGVRAIQDCGVRTQIALM